MLARLRSSNIADYRDILLFVGVGLVVFVITVVWALTFSSVVGNIFTLSLIVLAAAIVTIIPYFTWGRSESHPIARAFVRFGLGLQVFGLLITPVGLYYETTPDISVPVGFGSFLAVFFGVFIAGFGGNFIAPKRA